MASKRPNPDVTPELKEMVKHVESMIVVWLEEPDEPVDESIPWLERPETVKWWTINSLRALRHSLRNAQLLAHPDWELEPEDERFEYFG